MLMLLAMRSCIQHLLRWFFVPLHARKGYRLPQSRCGDKHRHSSHKPEWLKHEIIRLKALMPQVGCRSIAHIRNRRFAASRKVTVGKTYVHQVSHRYDYEIQILRRNLNHIRPHQNLDGKTPAEAWRREVRLQNRQGKNAGSRHGADY